MLKGRELWLAALTIVLITIIYGGVVWLTKEVPASGDLFGHLLGILGFILMLMTETLYSLRKRSRSARWGRMTHWLEFHIFTGLVGPYMVLLHTAWKYNGLAGITTLMMVIIVGSGFIGRYIYTRVPRTLDGTIIEGQTSEAMLRQARRMLALWHAVHIPLGVAMFAAAFLHIGAALYYATFLK